MKSKIIFNVICSVFLLISLAACSASNSQTTPTAEPPTQGTSPQPTSSVSGLCSNPLYPVIQGATWTYSNTGSPAGSFTYTDTITSVRPDGFTLTTQFTDLTRTQEWACKQEGLQALQLGGANSAAITTQGLSAEFTSSNVTGITLPANITSAMQWTYGLDINGSVAMPGDQSAEASGTVSIDLKEAGSESVTVPAGTFNATKIEAKSTFDLNASFQGIKVPVKFTDTSILFYVPGVGLVKSIENGDIGGNSFSSTTELQTYNIP